MKIMFVTVGMAFGGAERVMALLSNCFCTQGLEVSIVAMDDEKRLAYPLHKAVDLRFMQTARFDKRGSLASLIRTLRRHICDVRPDVIVSFFSSAFFFSAAAAWGMGIPMIYSERNDPNHNIRGFKAKAFQAFALLRANYVVFQTAGARDYYGRKLYRKSTIILNPFDGSSLPDAPENREKTLVSVGRLSEQKNQKILIDAFAEIARRYPEHKLVLYGDGPLRQMLQNRIDAYGLTDRIFLPGNVRNIYETIHNAALFLFSSDFEGLPNALIEAMALGLPCISTDCSPGGARALIEDGVNGILVPCGSPKKMAEAIAFLLDHPDCADKMGSRAREITKRLDIGKIAAQWRQLFEQVIRG